MFVYKGELAMPKKKTALTIEERLQQAAEQALASIDLMKKSILARAFRGELGTNKASEASALELLKQVLAEN